MLRTPDQSIGRVNKALICRLKAVYGGLLNVEKEEGVIAGMTECLATVEEDAETFVPDPFNWKTRYCILKSRQHWGYME